MNVYGNVFGNVFNYGPSGDVFGWATIIVTPVSAAGWVACPVGRVWVG